MIASVRKSASSCGTSIQRELSETLIGLIHRHVPAWHRHLCITGLLVALQLFAVSLTASSQSLSVYGGDFLKATFQSPKTVLMPAISSGFAIVWSDYVESTEGFGSDWQGYGHHYVVSLADNVNGKFMRKFVFAAASRRRDNYRPNAGGFRARVALAAAHTLYASPGADGWELNSKTLNWSGIPASFAAAGLSNVYQPAAQRNWSSTLVRVGTNTAGYALSNVLGAVIDDFKQKHPRFLHRDHTKDFPETGTPDSP
jgi:hypothetical protein